MGHSFVELYHYGKRVKRRKNNQWLYTTSLEVLQLLQKILGLQLARLTSLSGMDKYSTPMRFSILSRLFSQNVNILFVQAEPL